MTTLIIPGFNDSDAELGELAAFIADVDPGIPWHVSAFHPTYRMTDRGRTLPETLHKAHAIGRAAGLRYVFTGNVLADKFESTYCPVCGKTVIERIGYSVKAVHIEDGGCRFCHTPIDGIY